MTLSLRHPKIVSIGSTGPCRADQQKNCEKVIKSGKVFTFDTAPFFVSVSLLFYSNLTLAGAKLMIFIMWLCVFREEDLIAKMRKYNDDADVELQKKTA